MPPSPSADPMKPADLPSLSGVALQVIQACARGDIDNQGLATLVTRDPVLTAEILRISNSPYFGFQREVSTVGHAVAVLGHRALRNLVLCTAIRDTLTGVSLPGIDLADFWSASLRRAVCARYLAEMAGLDRDQAFTIGLLQDLGRLALFVLNPEQASHWNRLAGALPDALLQLEQDLFGEQHAKFTARLLELWGLPDELVQVIKNHHDPLADEPGADFRAIAQCADWMGAVFVGTDAPRAVSVCHGLLERLFAVEEQLSEELLQRSTHDVTEAAAALGFQGVRALPFEDVMREANLRLAEENLCYQDLTWRLEHALADRDRYADALRRELELAREVQHSLLPDPDAGLPGVHGINLAARELSGDFFDYFRLEDGRVCFCIADVAGKGMNAALLMAKTASLFRCLGKGDAEPASLLATLNAEIAETSVRGMFVTLTAGILDPATGVVRLANAGHLPALLIAAEGRPRAFPSTAPPLGVLSDAKFSEMRFSLGSGSLYLFTDGLVEARLGQGKRLEVTGLINLLRKHSGAPPRERLPRVIDELDGLCEGVDDDRTLLVIESG